MTNAKFQDNPIGLFTPASVDDFVERARNVSRFLGMGRRHAEERLAKLYGYAGAHDIRIAINKMVAEGVDPGPYNSEANNHVFGKSQRLSSMARHDRGNACLDMANEATGDTRLAEMSTRAYAFREIGLFSEMGDHRRLMREHSATQDTLDVLKGREPPSADGQIRPPQDYATVRVNRYDSTCKLAFTTLGKGLGEAIAHVMHPDNEPDYHDRDAKLAVLQRMHAENPYVHAARCVNDCYAIIYGRPDARQATAKALQHYDAAAPLFDRLYADMPEGVQHAGTRGRSYMTSFEMDSSGMRIMCEQLLEALRIAKVTGRSRELSRRLAFFNVGRDGRDRMAA